jgi:hypothetical protein
MRAAEALEATDTITSATKHSKSEESVPELVEGTGKPIRLISQYLLVKMTIIIFFHWYFSARLMPFLQIFRVGLVFEPH